MTKKIISILLCAVMLLLLMIGCEQKSSTNSADTAEEKYLQESREEHVLPVTGGVHNGRFVQIGEYDYDDDFYIVYDQCTLVVYVVSNSEGNKGTFSPLYNSDGTLLTYNPSID